MENGHIQRAELLMGQHRYDLAEAELRQILSHDPEDGPALALLALCRLNLGDIPQAEEFANQAIGAAPDWALPYYVRAVVLADQVKLDEAVRQVKRAIELAPTDPDYHGFLAHIQVALNHPEEGIDTARIGLQHNPEHVLCLNLIARERTKTGHFNEAESNLRTSLEVDPENADTLTLLGELQLRRGETEDARQTFDQALAIHPGNTEAQSGLSEARRAGNAIYRWLLPMLLRGDILTRAEPLISRLMMLTLIWVLWAVSLRLPVGRPVGIAVAILGTIVLTILMLAKPLMNLQFCRKPLQWYALPWRERFMSSGLIVGSVWLGTCAWVASQTGINNPLFLLALTNIVPLIPITAIGSHHAPDVKRALWPYAGASLALWLIPAAAYCLHLIASTETVGMFAAASFIAGVPKMSAMMDAESVEE